MNESVDSITAFCCASKIYIMGKEENKLIGSRINVPVAFQDVFSHFYTSKNTDSKAITQTLLPGFQTLLIFNFGDAIKISTDRDTKIAIEQCLVLGPVKQGIQYTLPPDTEILVANFKDDAFFRFFGPVLTTEALSTHPDNWMDENCFADLWKVLGKMKNAKERINHILEFCKPYLNKRNEIAEQLAGFDEENTDPIKSIAEKRQQSKRHIQQTHKTHFGYSAKAFSRYQRFLKAIQLLQKLAQETAKVDWFDIIDQCGYYDQSQLIRDFKHFIHLSPTQYLNYQQEICNPN